MAAGNVVVVGGTQGLGRELAQVYADEGRDVIVTGRDPSRAETAAHEIGGATRGIRFANTTSTPRSGSSRSSWSATRR
jgi:short-subunit dehydrogenase